MLHIVLCDKNTEDMSQLEYTPDLIDFMPGAKDVDIVYELTTHFLL